ncbi:MAG: hypothetical protein IT436_08665 [Phycisphaerales bacterium]|nr:hypothetical protein [Phycisphaerales bacterium]
MSIPFRSVRTFALSALSIAALAGCTSDKAPPPATASRTVAAEEGVAGGTIVDTVRVSATVAAKDTVNRRITLLGADGKKTTFKAGPEIVNFPQIKVGDRVNATLTQELVVFVRPQGSAPGAAAATAVAVAPKGAKPGVMMADTVEVTATLLSMDMVVRTATLRFEDGTTRTVKVRPDVDMTNYGPGDTVVIRMTEALAILVDKP